jgi:hypothetical protein
VRRFEALLAERPASHWIRTFRAAGAPAAEVRALDQLYDCPQVGVHAVLDLGPGGTVDPNDAAVRIVAWTAATVGYMAGVGEWALAQAVDYTRSRRAFGSTLASLPPVQQRLADAATAVRGARLLAGTEPGGSGTRLRGTGDRRGHGHLPAGGGRDRLHARVPAPAGLPARARCRSGRSR